MFGPIINIIAASAAGMPVNPQKNRKMSSIVIPSMAVFAFVVLVMNSCGIWSILGIGGALVWFYTALALIGVILLAVVFLNM